MNLKQKEFLEDTRDILVGYDGCGTIESLQDLIDEARERIHFTTVINFDEYPLDTDFNNLFYKMDLEKRGMKNEAVRDE